MHLYTCDNACRYAGKLGCISAGAGYARHARSYIHAYTRVHGPFVNFNSLNTSMNCGMRRSLHKFGSSSQLGEASKQTGTHASRRTSPSTVNNRSHFSPKSSTNFCTPSMSNDVVLPDSALRRSSKRRSPTSFPFAAVAAASTSSLCEFYSIPNSPRGGKRENRFTLLQTVLHWFETLRVVFCRARRTRCIRATRGRDEKQGGKRT